MHYNQEVRLRNILATLAIAVFCIIAPLSAHAQPVKFGVPPWPGVTVKTEVVAQILEAIGYESKQVEVSAVMVYNGLTTGDVDAYLASWIPLQNELFNPLNEKNAFEIVGTNLDEAGVSLAVPNYVWDAGVRSIADLAPNADKFENTIYSIEVGSGMQTSTEKIIDNNVANLGDWKMLCSPVPAMIKAVQDKIKHKQWVVFHGWRPHWMNFQMDMKFLTGVPGTEGLVNESIVYTLASNDFKDRFPQVHTFLKNLYISGHTQSEWINEYGFKEQAPETVAKKWIKNNMKTIAPWLKGVKAANGKPAMEVLRKAIAS